MLKVKDKKEYEFDPAKLVLSICEIYINLSQSESFTLAVSQDGRSYSPKLFKLAQDVLGTMILENSQANNNNLIDRYWKVISKR